jgi:hypothetical protein
VVRGITIVKQKRQACAVFLGVRAVSINVLRVCCILTTIFRVFVLSGRHAEPEKSSTGGITEGRHFCESTFHENTAPVASDSPHEKGRSGGRCGLLKRCTRQTTV